MFSASALNKAVVDIPARNIAKFPIFPQVGKRKRVFLKNVE